MLKRVTSQFSVETFCLTIPNKILRETLLCFNKSLVTKIFTDRGGGGEGGSMTNFCRKFLSHSAEKARRGTFLCFTKFLVSKKFMDRRGRRRGMEYRDFLSKVSV